MNYVKRMSAIVSESLTILFCWFSKLLNFLRIVISWKLTITQTNVWRKTLQFQMNCKSKKKKIWNFPSLQKWPFHQKYTKIFFFHTVRHLRLVSKKIWENTLFYEKSENTLLYSPIPYSESMLLLMIIVLKKKVSFQEIDVSLKGASQTNCFSVCVGPAALFHPHAPLRPLYSAAH